MIKRTVNQTGLNLIKYYESLRLNAYQDSVKRWTIGYGHTGQDVHPNQVITVPQAVLLFNNDVNEVSGQISAVITNESITDNQYAAVASFTFNLGIGTLEKSTLLKLINQGNFKDAAAQFIRFINADGKPSNGLLARRRAEQDLFLVVS